VSTDNIVPFKIVSPDPHPLPEGETVSTEFSPEQLEVIESIKELTKFLHDNLANVQYFVCCAAVSNPEVADPDYSENHVFATPIHASQFALAIKILDSTFFKKLHNGGL